MMERLADVAIDADGEDLVFRVRPGGRLRAAMTWLLGFPSAPQSSSAPAQPDDLKKSARHVAAGATPKPQTRAFDEETDKRIAAAYLVDGLSIPELVARFGGTNPSIGRALDRQKVKRRTGPEAMRLAWAKRHAAQDQDPAQPVASKFDPRDTPERRQRDAEIAAHYAAGATMKETRVHFRCNLERVDNALKRTNTPRRPPGVQPKSAAKSGAKSGPGSVLADNMPAKQNADAGNKRNTPTRESTQAKPKVLVRSGGSIRRAAMPGPSAAPVRRSVQPIEIPPDAPRVVVPIAEVIAAQEAERLPVVTGKQRGKSSDRMNAIRNASRNVSQQKLRAEAGERLDRAAMQDEVAKYLAAGGKVTVVQGPKIEQVKKPGNLGGF